jgi:hypothetical protein
MIILKISEPGHTIDLPGMQTVRSPVEIDISKIDTRLVMLYLAKAGIKKFEIKSGDDTVKKEIKTKTVKTKKKVKVEEKSNEMDYRIDKIERVLTMLAEKSLGDKESNREQIIKKIENLEEKIVKNQSAPVIIHKSSVEGEPDIEDIDSFIPDVDISDMTLKSSDNIQKVKQDEGLDDAADVLAGLMKKG